MTGSFPNPKLCSEIGSTTSQNLQQIKPSLSHANGPVVMGFIVEQMVGLQQFQIQTTCDDDSLKAFVFLLNSKALLTE